MGEAFSLHLVVQDHQDGSGFRTMVLPFYITLMLYLVCSLSIIEAETWTEMNWLHLLLDKTNTTWQEQIFEEQTWFDCHFYWKDMSSFS